MHGRLDLFKTTKTKPQFPKPQWNTTRGPFQFPKDPHAMDTPLDESRCKSQKWMTSCTEAIDGLNPSITWPIGQTNFNPQSQGSNLLLLWKCRTYCLQLPTETPIKHARLMGRTRPMPTTTRTQLNPSEQDGGTRRARKRKGRMQ